MSKPFINNNGTIIEFNTEAELLAYVDSVSPVSNEYKAFINSVQENSDENMGGFRVLKPKAFEGQTVGAQTIDIATFQIPTNIFGKTKIEVFIVNPANGDFGIGEFVVSWRRFTNGTAQGSIHPTIALQTPNTLSGITLPPLVYGPDTITSRFTGKVGITVSVFVKFSSIVYKF